MSQTGAGLPNSVRRLLYIAPAVGVGLIAWAQIALRADAGYLFDFYPLYRGAEALLLGRDAYAIDAPPLPALGVEAVGNAYPLHAVLLLGLPFVWMPPAAAVVAWTIAVGIAWILAVRWAGESPYWFLWLPMWQALLIQQPSAALGVAAIIALGALRRGSPWILGLCIALLAAKPQQFLVLCLVLAWWGRGWWRQMAVVWGGLAAASFLAQPDWIQRWLERVEVRATLVPATWLGWLIIPAAGVLAFRGWRESSLAVASTGIGPWPTVGGYYTAVAWPLGTGRTGAAAFAFLGLLGFIAGEALGASTSAFAAVVAVGIGLMALCTPRRNRDLTAPPGGTVRRAGPLTGT